MAGAGEDLVAGGCIAIPPPDSLHPAATRSLAQAIALLQQEIDRTATKWESAIAANSLGSVDGHNGSGFFTNGDSQTGNWQTQKGFFWTGGFWVGELWKMYARTHDEKYRRWADLWTSRMTGAMETQNHDVGFLYYYSSVVGFEQTQDPKLRGMGIRAADRLLSLFNPRRS
jgi:unsaturated chondroitin disaccharide hydrolase